MIFSKSFGYAVRGILYISVMQDKKKFLQAEEIANNLSVPRHFMSKILKRLAKEGIIASVKGPAGGFSINAGTLDTPLILLFEKIEGMETFHSCVLRLRACNSDKPCPLHNQMMDVKSRLAGILADTTIGSLLKEDKSYLLHSIST